MSRHDYCHEYDEYEQAEEAEGCVAFWDLMFDTIDFELRCLGFKQAIDSLVCAFIAAELAVQNDNLRDVADNVSILILLWSKRVRDFVLILDKHDRPNVVDREVEDTTDD